ncbi:PQ-loop domain-containing transporter [Mycoplasmopsis bovis]|nr:PQ-loop domain-containing transporter [Mycoplasmopsis bovis]QQH21465.1 PQ-loop domain-containing transporter [Mycoplasmopsis bovis]
MSALTIVNLIFGVLASSSMVIICIPQLISILKSKSVGNISYGTFLIYFFGGALFILIMVLKKGIGSFEFDSIKNPDSDPIVNIIGNWLFMLIMATTITSFLNYDKNKPLSFKLLIGLIIWVICLVFTIWFFMVYANEKFRLNLSPDSVLLTIFTVCATVCTSLPFTLQIIKTLRSKSAEGLSPLMLYLGMFINACLAVYLGTLLPFTSPMWWVCVIFSCLAIVVYMIQIFLYYYYKKMNNSDEISANNNIKVQ